MLNNRCNEIEFDLNITYNNITYSRCHYTIDGMNEPCKTWSFDKTYYQSTLTEEWSMVGRFD